MCGWRANKGLWCLEVFTTTQWEKLTDMLVCWSGMSNMSTKNVVPLGRQKSNRKIVLNLQKPEVNFIFCQWKSDINWQVLLPSMNEGLSPSICECIFRKELHAMNMWSHCCTYKLHVWNDLKTTKCGQFLSRNIYCGPMSRDFAHFQMT